VSSLRPRILLIGSLPRCDQPVGGTVVSFATLVEGLRLSANLDLDVIDTSRPPPQSGRIGRAVSESRALAKVLRDVVARARRCDAIMLNVSSGTALRAGPLLWITARLFGLPIVTRVFGGELDLVLARAPAWRRRLAFATVLRSQLLLLQTQALCDQFDGRDNVRRLPTSRIPSGASALGSRPCRRFVMLSQLRPEKGVVEAVTAMASIPDDCTLDVYGPRMPGTDMAWFADRERVRYCGELAQTDVPAVLAAHDALVFPSYHAGEGLPGAVIEALQAGLPVIAARWRSLPELVVHESSGLLVAPRSVEELAAAMTRLSRDRALFTQLCRGARERGLEFDASHWTAQIETWLLAVASGAPVEADRDEADESDVAPALPAQARPVSARRR
jgi:hypothetical protein